VSDVASLGGASLGGASLGGASLCRRDIALYPDLAPALAELGRLQGERRWLARALVGAPGLVAARIDLGVVLLGAGDAAGAARLLRGTLALEPGEATAWFNLGVLRGSTPEAAEAYRRSLGLAAAADAATNLADVLRDGESFLDAIPFYRRALSLVPALPTVIDSLAFLSSYDPQAKSEEIFRLNRRWGALQQRPETRPVHSNPPEPARRLRIGYLSADLHDHPVGRNLVGLIEHHSQAVEAFFYAGREVDDRIQRRLKARAAGWRSTAGLDDAALVQAIRADDIDLLVILAGHTAFNRLPIAAYRPAPVTVAMHDLTSSGLDEVDAVLGDAITMPEGGEERFTERIARLPSFYLHEPLPPVPIAPVPIVPGPIAPGPGAPLLLVSANNPAKLNDRVIDLWIEILKRLPEARLLLKYRDRFGDPLIQRRWIGRAGLAGIGADRLLFRTGDEDLLSHLAVIGSADIALDPFPFNGATTTYEALWMGVPVVTCLGRRFVGRVAAAMLATLDLPELIAADEPGYLAAVLGLARDPGRRARLRAGLRARLEASALLDAPAYARAVEAQYRLIWEEWCRRSKPDGGSRA